MPPKPELSSAQRRMVVSQLLARSKGEEENNKLKRGALTEVANLFAVNPRTIARIWKRARLSFEDPDIGAFRASPRKDRGGRMQQHDRDAIREAILLVPTHQRRTLRTLASAIGIPLSTLHSLKQDKTDSVILSHSNALKPHLQDHHKFARVLYAVANLDLDTEEYSSYFNSIHIDEKWFFLTEEQLHMYLVPGETPPSRRVGHKSHILKVMFLVAVARPRFVGDECTFDGKIGAWPFVEQVVAQRTSVNRPAGTVETKPVSVTLTKYREFLVEKVLPAIKEKWPCRNRNIVIQQDGASSHITQDDPEFVAAATQGHWNVTILTQPAQSPDTNLLDLTFFRAMQSSQWNHGFANEINGLIAQVMRAYDNFPPRKIDFGFLTLASCLDEIICSNGDNSYSIPHMGKERHLRAGTLPVQVEASPNAIAVATLVMVDEHLDVDDDSDNN